MRGYIHTYIIKVIEGLSLGKRVNKTSNLKPWPTPLRTGSI